MLKPAPAKPNLRSHRNAGGPSLSKRAAYLAMKRRSYLRAKAKRVEARAWARLKQLDQEITLLMAEWHPDMDKILTRVEEAEQLMLAHWPEDTRLQVMRARGEAQLLELVAPQPNPEDEVAELFAELQHEGTAAG